MYLEFVLMITITRGTMAWGPALPTVVENRKISGFVAEEYMLPVDFQTDECLFAVPYTDRRWLGEEVFWLGEDGSYTRGYVVDVSAPWDEQRMYRNGLAGDTNCEELVHKKGRLVGFRTYLLAFHVS